MDMSLREWLILIGVIIIAGVMIDGYRRMRVAKKRSSELSFGLEEVRGSEEDFSSELPNGGARRTPRSRGDSDPMVKDRVEPEFSTTDPLASLSSREEYSFSEDEELQLHRRMAEFVEPVPSYDSSFNAVDQSVDTLSLKSPKPPQSDEADLGKPVPVLTSLDASSEKKSEKPAPKASPAVRKVKTGSVKETPVSADSERSRNQRQSEKKEATEKLSERPPAREVIVINVLTKGGDNGGNFDGGGLDQFLRSSGMCFGDMGIFHRHVNTDGSGKVLFSMANGMEPGSFNVDKLEETETHIVSFFMGLPGPQKPMQAFTIMEETAQRMALDLGGELKDEHLSIMTQQTLEYCRQRISEYERKQLASKVPG